MLREHYIYQLDSLRNDLFAMGTAVEKALHSAMKGLESRNAVIAEAVIAGDQEVNATQHLLEERSVRLMATQQPVASDLRLIASIIAIAGELERIGDYANSIARRSLRPTLQNATLTPSPEMFALADQSRQMLRTSLEAFMNQDVALAHSLKQAEERVDALEKRVRGELMHIACTDLQRVEAAIDLLDIVHVLERVADRATNIGERVIYQATSATEDLNP